MDRRFHCLTTHIARALTVFGIAVAMILTAGLSARTATAGSGGPVLAPDLIPPPLPFESVLGGGASEVLTTGHRFTDRSGRQVLLKSINWEGFNDDAMMARGLDRQPLSHILDLLRGQGFNSVRFLFSNYMLHQEHRTTDAMVSGRNPELAGLIPREAFYRVAGMITAAGLYVIVDNHQTRPMYYNRNEGQWFTPEYDEKRWLNDWDYVAYLFRDDSRVIGYEFRNEVRSNNVDPHEPLWGGGGAYDWRRAQIEAASTVWRRNPAKISFISGLDYNSTLRPVAENPITARDFPDLHGPIHLAYSIHSFAWFSSHDSHGISLNTPIARMDASEQTRAYDSDFGFAVASDSSYTAPIWLSEFGVPPAGPHNWAVMFDNLITYMSERQISFGYYTLSSWYAKEPQYSSYCYDKAASWRHEPAYETHCDDYGLLDRNWSAFVDDWRLEALRPLLNSP